MFLKDTSSKQIISKVERRDVFEHRTLEIEGNILMVKVGHLKDQKLHSNLGVFGGVNDAMPYEGIHERY